MKALRSPSRMPGNMLVTILVWALAFAACASETPDTTFDDSVGAAQLYTAWRDPQFNPRQKAFYYVRVLQVPTPRWTAYDAKKFGIVMPDYVPMVTQERAYSSPIWYTPG